VQCFGKPNGYLVTFWIDGNEFSGMPSRRVASIQLGNVFDRTGKLERRTAVEQHGERSSKHLFRRCRRRGQVKLPPLCTSELPMWSQTAPEAIRGHLPPICLTPSTEYLNDRFSQPRTVSVSPELLSENTEVEVCHYS
jgi:hypothetical protein